VAWPRSVDELIAAQHVLAAAVPEPWVPVPSMAIGGCAIRFPRGGSGPGDAGDPAWAAAAVGAAKSVVAGAAAVGAAAVVAGEAATAVETAESVVAGAAAAPYEPGLLALREGPLLGAAVRGLAVTPDVLLVDATGRDHPRRAGLALHLGAVLDLPTVGVTHRPLLADGPWPDDVRGASSPLLLDGELVGAWLRTRRGARPVAVHAAWRTTVPVAIDVVLAALGRHRTPEPLRRARHLARIARNR
jgi:deoxyribonuclease V